MYRNPLATLFGGLVECRIRSKVGRVRWLMFSDSIECAKIATAFYADVFNLESVVLV